MNGLILRRIRGFLGKYSPKRKNRQHVLWRLPKKICGQSRESKTAGAGTIFLEYEHWGGKIKAQETVFQQVQAGLECGI